jgi:uncharacterized protein (TIGR03067 family)
MMTSSILAVACSTLLFMAGTWRSGFTGEAASDLARFQGDWRLISAERDGKKMAEEEAQKFKLTITSNRFVLRKSEAIVSEGTFTLDATRKPKEIDETITTGPNKGKVYAAIYEIDDERHRICFAAPGKDRPMTFSSEPGSGHLLQLWRRSKN